MLFAEDAFVVVLAAPFLEAALFDVAFAAFFEAAFAPLFVVFRAFAAIRSPFCEV